MCSIQDESDLIQPQKRTETSLVPRKCMKCEKVSVVIIRMNDALCRDCFVEYTTHKFRSAFGKSKIVRDQEKVLVAFSGGAGSSAMVHLIQGGLSKRAQKKLRFVPSLVYIDEGATLKQTWAERCQTTQEVVALMRGAGLSHTVHCIEQVMSVSSVTSMECSSTHDNIDTLVRDEDDEALSSLMGKLRLQESSEKKFHNLIDSAKSLTSKENLVNMLRLRLLGIIAKQQGVSKVLLGDSATTLSVRLLSNISQGKGSSLPYEISFADKRFGDILFVRPMREFTAKEVAVYNQLNQVETFFIANLSTKVPPNTSIERLTESFVTGLQAEFPNTVSTIFRTGEKFGSSQQKCDEEERCCLCRCPLDTAVESSSALNATKFSQSLCSKMSSSHSNSEPGKAAVGSSSCRDNGGCHGDEGSRDQACCGEGDGSCKTPKRLTYADMEPRLCYGCRLTVKDLVSMDALPPAVTDEASRTIRRAQMKDDISEFLLDE